MTQLFISYSRKDKEFAQKLNAALESLGFESWIDWNDIPPTADWWDQIQKGIESADGFLFLLSPDSVTSKVCKQEIEHAVQNGKRLIPLLVRDVTATDVHPTLTKLNWIFFREQDDFATSLKKLEAGIKTDLPWVEAHRRLQIRAVEWDKRKDRSLFLRGKDLREAEEHLASAGQKDPLPTDLQRQYVLESRRGEIQNRNRILVIGAVVVVLLALLSVFAFNQRNLANSNAATAVANRNAAQTSEANAVNEANARATAQADAEEQARISRAGELAAQAVLVRDSQFDLSLLLSAEAFRTADIPRTKNVLLENIQKNPQLLQYISPPANSGDVVVSQNRSRLATIAGKTIILWDTISGKQIGQPLSEDMGYIYHLAFNPDGSILASSDSEGNVLLWDMQTNHTSGQPLKGFGEYKSAIAFSSDGKTLVASDGINLISWDMRTLQPTESILNHQADWVWDLAFSQDGKLLVTDQGDGTLILWDVSTHQIIRELSMNHSYYSYTFSPEEKLLALGGGDGSVTLVDLTSGETLGESLKGHSDRVLSVAFSPDGTKLASASFDKTIILWDVYDKEPIGPPLIGHTDSISSLVFCPDGKTLVSFGFDNKIIFWDLINRHPLGEAIQGHTGLVYSLSFSPNGKTIASGSEDGTIILWDIGTRQPIGSPLIDGSWVYSITFSPDGKFLAAGDLIGMITLWNVTTHKQIDQPLAEHMEAIDKLAFSPDGKTLAALDGKVTIWDMSTRIQVGRLPTENLGTITDMAFSPNGKILATIGNEIVLWDTSTYQQIGQPMQSPFGSNIAFSPDGQSIASDGNNITLWDVNTQKSIKQFLNENYADVTNGLVFSPDGKLLISKSAIGQIILWDVATGKAIEQPLWWDGVSSSNEDKYRGPRDAIAFNPNGKVLATNFGEDVILWDMYSSSWLEKICQRAGRNFSRAEWTQYFPNEPYRATCPQWPLEPEATATPTITPTP